MDKPPSAEAVSRVVRWAVLLFFAYALLSGGLHLFSGKAPPPPANATLAEKSAYQKQADCESQNNPLKQFSQIATFLPVMLPSIHIQDVKPGEGPPAICGQRAELRFSYRLENGTEIVNNLSSPEPVKAIIGDGTLLHGVEIGMLGLKAGGERKLIFPSVMGFGRVKNFHSLTGADKFAVRPEDLKSSIIITDIKLDSLSPTPPATLQPLRVIDRKFTRGQRAQCGDTVKAELTIWKLDGTKLYSTVDDGGSVTLTLGVSQAPYGVEQALMNMSDDALRTAIIPAAYTRPLITDIPWPATPRLLGTDINWPNETLLMDIHMLHVSTDAPLDYTRAPEKFSQSATHGTETPKDKMKKPKTDEDDDDDDKP